MHTAVPFLFHSAVQKLLIYLTSTYFFCFELPASLGQITVTLHSWSKNSEPLWKDFRSFTLFFREAHGCAQERNKEVSRISANTFNSGEHCCLMLPADFESARIVTLDAGKLFGGGERMTHRVFGAWQALSHCLVSAYRSDFEKFRCHREQVTAAWLAREKKLGNTLVGLM